MYTSKSFCSISAYVSNVPGVTSPVGEMSTEAETYTRELGVYKSTTLAGYNLINLKSVNQAGTKMVMHQTLVEEGVKLSNHIYTYVQSQTGQIFYDTLLTTVVAYAATLGITNLSLGPVVQHGSLWYPNFIKWSSTAYTADSNENTIWFSLAALSSQYTDFEIVVVPPVDNLDAFFQSYVGVNTLLNTLTLTQTMERVQTARAGKPYTILRSDAYDYINPINSAQHLNTDWSILIYGPTGNNIDSIKDAMVDYILANSTHTRAEWTVIFPDIFKRTEFVLAPHWYQYAISPRIIDPIGIYSPAVNVNHIVTLLRKIAPNYTNLHVTTNASIFGAPYESVAISCVGGPENRDSLFRFSQVFEDYINVGTASVDFSRMETSTQEFCTMLGNMLPIAESMAEFTDMPAGFTKLYRDGIWYVVKTHENIQYLVASKLSVDAIATIETWID
jgi:hypothetical protein